MPHRLLLTPLLAFALTGCITIPAPLQGEYSELPPPNSVDETDRGQDFRWGGTLIEARPGERVTCLELLARELDRQYRPVPGDKTYGRFRACHDGFLDPEVFAPGREVTVVGQLEDFEDDTVGEYAYRFPRLTTTSVYLWPERVEYIDRYDYFYYGPGWRHYGWPYWPYGGPYWIGYRHFPTHAPIRGHLRDDNRSAPATPAPAN